MTSPRSTPGIAVVGPDGVVLRADDRALALLSQGATGPLRGRLRTETVADGPGLVRCRWEHEDGSSIEVDCLTVAHLGATGEGSVKLLWRHGHAEDPPAIPGASSAFLEAVLDSVEEGIVACDAEGRLALFNRASRRLHGLPEERLPPAEWAERYSLFRADGRTPMPTDEIPLLRAFRGEEVGDHEMVIAVPGRPPRTLLATGRAIVDAGGAKLGAVVSMRDVTEQRRAQEAERLAVIERAAREAAEHGQRRAALLARISARLDASLGVERRLRDLVDELVPEMADMCIVRLGTSKGAAVVAGAQGDRTLHEGLERLMEMHPPSADAPGWMDAIATGGSELGIRSFLAVPLRARGRTLGALSLLMTDATRRLGQDEQLLAEEIGRRAGVAIDNARLFEEEERARLDAESERRRTTQLQDLALRLSAAMSSVEVADLVAAAIGEALGSGTACVVHGDEAEPLSSDRAVWARCVSRLGGPAQAAECARRALEQGSAAPSGRDAVVVPLGSSADGRPAAVVVAEPPEEPAEDPTRQLAAMAVIARQALERAAAYDTQRELAQALQRSLLPSRLPRPAFADLAVHYAPARGTVGGDFYDAVHEADRLSLVVGDVVGQGAPAAAVMGQLRSAWRALVAEPLGPQEIVTRMSRLSRSIDGATVATLVCASLDHEGLLTYAAAGHPPPLLRTAEGTVEYLWEGRGTPLGVCDREQGVASIGLGPGDLVLLFTDGIIENPDRSLDAGLDQLARTVREAAGEDPAALLRRVGSAICDARDDCALLAVRFGGAGIVVDQ